MVIRYSFVDTLLKVSRIRVYELLDEKPQGLEHRDFRRLNILKS